MSLPQDSSGQSRERELFHGVSYDWMKKAQDVTCYFISVQVTCVHVMWAENNTLKVGLSLYLISLSLFAYLSLIPDTNIPVEWNYLSLFMLFFIPVLLSLKFNLPKWMLSGFVLITVSVTMLAAIGPNEAGFYGYDPTQSLESYRLFRDGWGLGMIVGGHWPGFPAFVSVVVEIVGLDVESVGKYLPLVASTVPLFLFIALSRTIGNMPAFFAGMGTASTRTLLMFEVKFIEEPFALVLLFFSIAVIFILSDHLSQSSLIFWGMFSLGLMHHYMAAVGVVIFVIWAVIPQLPLPDRFETLSTNNLPSIAHGLIPAIVLAIVFLYPYAMFSRFVILELLFEIATSPPRAVEGGTSDALRQAISRARYAVYALMSALIVWAVLSRTKLADWEQSWAVLAGIFSIGFLGSVIGGETVPLAGGRFLIIMIPLLISVSVTVVVLNRVSIPRSRVVIVILVLGLITTQLAAIEPYRIDTNPSQMIHPEAHYTSSEYSTTNWMTEYGRGQLIIDEQPHLWEIGYNGDSSGPSGLSYCQGYSVERDNYLGIDQWARPPNQEVIYSAGGISIGRCS
ncbi:hypothetical protein ACFQE1_01040 [Halobium palmae]|uniref:Uncharacterized protein n=1 Tax=Halobium palmae TaxID=1776492 RepID=A0ABD5RV32_9EURY